MNFFKKHTILKYFLLIFIGIFSLLMIGIIQEIIFEPPLTKTLFFHEIYKNFILALVSSCVFIIPILIISVTKKEAQKYYFDKEDFNNYKGYYRDIINNYSPAILSYIDDYQISNKEIIATILDLQLKNYIKIDEKTGKIIILNNDYTYLDKSEKYILTHINNLKDINYPTWKMLIKEEAINKNLIINCKNKKKLLFVLIATIILLALDLLIFILTKKVLNILFLMLFIFPIYVVTIHFYFMYVNNQHYTRTPLGKEINKKLEGLKNFLKDFSILDERSKTEISIWKEYLIYSVLFNQNQTIINEITNNLNLH